MPQTIATLITSFLLTFLTVPLVISFFKRKKIFDKPGGRKIHKTFTPSMGGISIFFGAIVGLLIWMPLRGLQEFKFFYGAMAIMFVTGLRDDLVPIKPLFKLVAQFLSSFMVIFLLDVRISSLYGFMGIGELPYLISILITTFVIIVITNSYNLIDGVDGLAGSIGFVAFFFFGIYFFLVDQIYYAMLAFSCLGALVAFLNFNWEPSRIFMGDTGSLALGGALGMTAVILKKELLLVIMGGVFVAEALSVILQVASFRLRGKRIFRMAPLHHHFELKGWPETRVVTRFWLIGVILALVALSTIRLQ